MAPRSVGTATISFGLVTIPAKLYPATQTANDISFHMLHKKCGTRLKQQYICPVDNEVVGRDEMVKGYEFARDRYVIFTPEELKALDEKSSQAIDIVEFVPLAKVDPVFFDKAYYLGPDHGGDRAYALLARAMLDTNRAAVANYAARGKQYLVLVRPHGNTLIMQQLHYADEVRSSDELDIAKLEVRENELKLAEQLISQITSESFNPEKYEDTKKNRVKEMIERKVAGEEIAEPSAEPVKAQVIDLMDALRASLQKSGASTTKAAAPAQSKEKADRKPAKRAPPSATKMPKSHSAKKG